MRAGLSCVVLAACGVDAGPPSLTAATPPHAPLVGGTRVTLSGGGFTAPSRVLIAGREAPLVATVDDATLELLVPPGEQPGDAEVVVLTEHGNAHATGLFHYSTPPQITGVSPDRVLWTEGGTVTVTGSGFLDEDAGDVQLALDGLLVADVVVRDDRTLTFRAPPGRALDEPDLELVDLRGRATRPRSFRYTPSLRPGLLLFPHFGSFAIFFDPVDNTVIAIPWAASPAVRLTTVVRDDRGDYWGADRNRTFGRIDLKTQRIAAPLPTVGWHPTMVRVGADHIAVDRSTLQLGRFDRFTAGFTPFGGPSALPCCGSWGLAHDGTTLYLAARDDQTANLYTVDVATGELGAPLPITGLPFVHLEDMRFFAGTLYGSNRNGQLLTIDPATGVAAVVPVVVGRISAMEIYE